MGRTIKTNQYLDFIGVEKIGNQLIDYASEQLARIRYPLIIGNTQQIYIYMIGVNFKPQYIFTIIPCACGTPLVSVGARIVVGAVKF